MSGALGALFAVGSAWGLFVGGHKVRLLSTAPPFYFSFP